MDNAHSIAAYMRLTLLNQPMLFVLDEALSDTKNDLHKASHHRD